MTRRISRSFETPQVQGSIDHVKTVVNLQEDVERLAEARKQRSSTHSASSHKSKRAYIIYII